MNFFKKLVLKSLFPLVKKSETRHHELNYLFWECTTRCNLNCRHCGSDCTKQSRFEDMPFSDFLRAVETIPYKENLQPLQVIFTGGEPLLRDDIERCGLELARRGIRWSMVSNGQLYDEKRHASLLKAGMGALTISLDGLEESHDWMRARQGSFEKVVNAISLAASSRRLNFDVVTCVNQRNLKELPKIKELLISKNVKAWRFFTIIPIGRAAKNAEMLLTDAQFLELMNFIKESRKDKRLDTKFSCEGYVGRFEYEVRDAGYFCRAGINIGSVLIDGSISACPNIDRTLAQGNIYKDNLYEVWCNRYENFRSREWTKTGRCADCKVYSECKGNGLHNWHGEKKEVLVCHHSKIENALKG